MAINIKGITVKQPYAQLLAVGAKHYETRSKPTRYRGPLAIHAGKDTLEYAVLTTETEVVSGSGSWHKKRDAIYAAFAAAGLTGHIPFGSIVAYAYLRDCYPVEEIKNLTETERMFGHWEPGRYAWEITSVVMLESPIAYKGQLGLWNVSDDAIRLITQSGR